MTNNEVLKKLRVALSLKDTDIIEILKMADFEISKGALGDLFRSEEHESFVEAGDQILRNFLNGLIIYKRGPEMKREGSTPKQRAEISTAVKKTNSKNDILGFKNPPTEKGKSGNFEKSNPDRKGSPKDKKSLFEKDFFIKKR
jgi:hypothetical protein